jgi:hypothetical protein
VERQLGTGGQAEVWLALDTELGEQVAIKVLRQDLRPEARERLKREVVIGRNLQHPNLVRVYELLDVGQRLAIVMEWLPGGSLADRVAGGEIDIADVVRWGEQALSALGYLHQHGVVHRDIKPSNLLLAGDGTLKLADLGLAKRLEDVRDLTRTSATVGTPMFMSPEQLRGGQAMPSSDLYALGVTLFMLVTGRLPYVADSDFEVARMHLQEAVPDPRRLRPDCPAWLAGFVQRLMEKRPGDRYRDAAAALDALHRERALLSPRLRRRLGVAAAIAIVACLTLTGGFAMIHARLEATRVVKVEAVDEAVHGVDARGREVWRIELASKVEQVEQVDLDGNGVPETIAATRPLTIVRGRDVKSEVLAVTRRGQVITHVSPEDVVSSWDYEFPKLLTPYFKAADLDGDGAAELIVRCNQRAFYPTALLVYWPKLDRWTTIAFHSGWLRDMLAVPGASCASLLVVGVNNRLGMLPVVGEVSVAPPAAAPSQPSEARAGSPENGIPPDSPLGWRWYTPLDQDLNPTRVAMAGDGAVILTNAAGATLRVDRFGNPDPGPNAGRDLARERRAFFAELGGPLSPTWQSSSAKDVADTIARIRKDLEPLMREAPYRAILGLYGSRALARVGDLAGAVRHLEATRADVPYEEVTYRLAHLLALQARSDTAIALLRGETAAPRTARAQYDAVHLLIRIAIERHDQALLRNAMTRFSFWRTDADPTVDTTGILLALAARAHVWWDEATGADAAARSWSYAPDGAMMAALSCWRLGSASEQDIAAVQAAIAANPEARWEGELALAAIGLALGRAGDAVARLGTAVAALEPVSRDDFMNRQLLDLARALFVRALAESGQRGEAMRQGAAVRPTLTSGLLPAILVDEALSHLHSDGASR